MPVSTRSICTFPPACSALSFAGSCGAVPVLYVMFETISGCADLNASMAGLVSARFPATSRMLSVTGDFGVEARVAAGVAPEAAEVGAEHAASSGEAATAPTANPAEPSSARRLNAGSCVDMVEPPLVQS